MIQVKAEHVEVGLFRTENSLHDLRYALAVMSVGVALGITDWLEPYTTLRTPLFYTAIISSAWFGGMGPGLLALALSTLAVEYYFAPTASVPESIMDGRLFILLFSLSGLLACWIRSNAEGRGSAQGSVR